MKQHLTKIALSAAIALVMTGCMKTVKLNSESQQKLSTGPIIVLENMSSDEFRTDTTMYGAGLLGMAIVGAVNAASGTYDELRSAPRATVPPLTSLRSRIVGHLKANKNLRFSGVKEGPLYTKDVFDSKKRIEQLAQYAKQVGYKGYILDIEPGTYLSDMSGISGLANLNFQYSAYVIIASSEGGEPLAQAQCIVKKSHDLSDFSKAGVELANKTAAELGKQCADQIIKEIF
ncbi:hypothetical protein [Polycladidibacter hongkongensis]|uniref:hypothetical protein n=1 Tax=Polycladidibacter hongkongensis TaxID=1647556 RepID=UPI000833A8A7|nr:hypothetical protein [Pseudovibrio hongkongensis]